MNPYEKIASIKQFTDNVGSIYGTEDFSIYLYSLIKMRKPSCVVELGTGTGAVTLWAGLALQENGGGVLYTVDNGLDWKNVNIDHARYGIFFNEDYSHYIDNILTHFELQETVNFINQSVADVHFNAIDILFSDFQHGPFDIVKLLSTFLPMMAEHSTIFFDSASTLYSSYHTLERIVDLFNKNKIPRSILEISNDQNQLQRCVESSEFRLHHIIENKNRNQNSTAMLEIIPTDIFPYPRIGVRF